MTQAVQKQRTLEQLESVIQTHLKGFIAAGDALIEIRDRKLYQPEHKNFMRYIESRWMDHGVSQVYKLMAGAEKAHIIEEAAASMNHGSLMPHNVSQMEALAGVPEELIPEVWEEAVEDAGGSQPTAARVQELARATLERLDASTQARILQENEDELRRRAPPRQARVLDLAADLKNAERKIKALERKLDRHGEETTRVCAALDRALAEIANLQ